MGESGRRYDTVIGNEIEYDETPTLALTHCSGQIHHRTTNNIPAYAYSYVECLTPSNRSRQRLELEHSSRAWHHKTVMAISHRLCWPPGHSS